MAKESQKGIYPCAMCGKVRSKDKGGTVFTVCDECWDKLHPQQFPKRHKPMIDKEINGELPTR